MNEIKKRKILIMLGCGICTCLVGIIIVLCVILNNDSDNNSSTATTNNLSANSNKNTKENSNIVEIEIPTTSTTTSTQETTTHIEELASGSVETSFQTENSGSSPFEMYGYISYFDMEMAPFYTDEIYEGLSNYQDNYQDNVPSEKASPSQSAEFLLKVRHAIMEHNFSLADDYCCSFLYQYKASNDNIFDKEILYNIRQVNNYYMIHDTVMTYEEEAAALKQIHDPVAFCSLVLESTWTYRYMKDGRGIYVYGEYPLLDQGEYIADKNDPHYLTAERNIGTRCERLYRFKFKFSDKYTLYAYIGYDNHNEPFLLSVEQLDGSFTTISELEGETDFLDEIFDENWYPGKYGAGQDQWEDYWEQMKEEENN